MLPRLQPGPAIGFVLLIAALPTAAVAGADEAVLGIQIDQAGFPDSIRMRLDLSELRLSGGQAPLRVPAVRSAAFERRATRRPAFVEGHLVPRMSQQLRQAPRIDFELWQQSGLVESNLYAWQTGTVRRYAERGAEKALEHYLLETPSLGRLVADVEHGLGSAHSRGRSTRIRMRLSHGTAWADLHHRMGAGSIRLGVDARGSARLDVYHGRLSHAHLRADYNSERDQYNLSCRLTF